VLSYDTAEVSLLIVLHYQSSVVRILRCTNYRAWCIGLATRKLSVRSSVKRVDCDKTEKGNFYTVRKKRSFSLVF